MKTARIGAMLLLIVAAALAQQAPYPPATAPAAPPAQQGPAQQAPLLTPDQLDNLVAPIALYPDTLLSQIVVASTYPLEIVEAQQWLQQNQGPTGHGLVDAAQQQGWAPSVAALVAFPDVLARLNQDVTWTTSLGNAYLAQPADVMTAIQRMRARAQQAGRLQSNAYNAVTTQTQNGQSAIVIQPVNPQVIYVPTYNPAYVWGAPAYGFYPPLLYPPVGLGFSWGPGIYVNSFFGGCCGWGSFGWGWAPSWFNRRIMVNNYFLHRFGFRQFPRSGFVGTQAWVHNPFHRRGVAYPNRALARRFRGNFASRNFGRSRNFAGTRGNFNTRNFNARRNFAAQRRNMNNRAFAAQQRRFGTPAFESGRPGANRSAFGGTRSGTRQRFESDRGFASMNRAGGGSRGGASRSRRRP